MTIKQLNKKLDDLLIDYLKREGYVKTGSLLKSIEFKCKFNQKTYELDFELEANEYIIYLNDGDLIQDFLNETTTLEVISEFIASQITLDS